MLEAIAYILVNCFYLMLYVTSSSSFPRPLSSEEEQRLIALFKKEGDTQAKCLLIEHNLRLVAHIIKKYYTTNLEQEDLISIGTVGLIKGINTFNPAKGASLSTYCARCIENEILMHFRNQKKTSSEVYLSDPIDCDKEGNTLSLLNILYSETSVDDIVEQKMTLKKLYNLVEKVLSRREKSIISMRYGLYNTAPRTQKEVAKVIGISRSYVSRIEKRALEKLKHAFLEK